MSVNPVRMKIKEKTIISIEPQIKLIYLTNNQI